MRVARHDAVSNSLLVGTVPPPGYYLAVLEPASSYEIELLAYE